MDSRAEKAAKLFGHGYNCAQSVLCVFCTKYGLDEEMAMKMASSMGSGFRRGEICGAACGGALVIGLKHGQTREEDKEAKEVCNAETTAFLNRFKEKKQSVVCREILKTSPKGSGRMACADTVRCAAQLLEEMGY